MLKFVMKKHPISRKERLEAKQRLVNEEEKEKRSPRGEQGRLTKEAQQERASRVWRKRTKEAVKEQETAHELRQYTGH